MPTLTARMELIDVRVAVFKNRDIAGGGWLTASHRVIYSHTNVTITRSTARSHVSFTSIFYFVCESDR